MSNEKNTFRDGGSTALKNFLYTFLRRLHWQGCATRWSRAARKWRDNEEMERDSFSTIFPHSLFIISSLSVHFLCQICHILAQNIKYGFFVVNVTQKTSRNEEIILGRIAAMKIRELCRPIHCYTVYTA